MNQIVDAVKKIKGSFDVPGDKSISHRALILGALAEGDTRIYHLSPGKDVCSTIECLSQLGVEIEKKGALTIVHGKGLESLHKPTEHLFAGNSGTTMRLLSGILASQPFSSTITGDSSLCKRPMKRITTPLHLMGAEIITGKDYTAPLKFNGKPLAPIHYNSPIASAQVKSCILLAGLYTSGRTSVSEPMLSRDHTERMLPNFNIPIENHNGTITIHGPAPPEPCLIDIPGDISSSAFFLTAAAMKPGSQLTLKNIGTNPTRSGILLVLQMMGARFSFENKNSINGEPRADLTITGSPLHGTRIDGDLLPKLIDEIPILAVAATQAEGITEIRDAQELRYKETDRIEAISENLIAMGAQLDVRKDGFKILGPQRLKGCKINSYGDHRIAMAFAIAGLFAEGDTIIQDSQCVDISFPGFFQHLRDISHE